MKTKKQIDVGLATRVATEHLSYRSLLQEIESDLERLGQGDAASLVGLKKLLHSFHSQARAHFALEERSGLFDLYDEHGSAFRGRAGAMLAQHRFFLETLQRLLATVAPIERVDTPEFAGFSRELRQLIAALRKHERDEDELLDRPVEHDIRRT